MEHFQIVYKSLDNITHTIIESGDYASEAIDNAFDDYDDIQEIIKCKQL